MMGTNNPGKANQSQNAALVRRAVDIALYRADNNELAAFQSSLNSALMEASPEGRLRLCKQVFYEIATIRTLRSGEMLQSIGEATLEFLKSIGDEQTRSAAGMLVFNYMGGLQNPLHLGFLIEFEREAYASSMMLRSYTQYDQQVSEKIVRHLRDYMYRMAIIKEDLQSAIRLPDVDTALDYSLTTLIDRSRDKCIAMSSLGSRSGYDYDYVAAAWAALRKSASDAETLITSTSDFIVLAIWARIGNEPAEQRSIAATKLLANAIQMIGDKDLELAYAVIHKIMFSKVPINFTEYLLSLGYRSNHEIAPTTPLYSVGGVVGNDYLGTIRRTMLRGEGSDASGDAVNRS